MLIYLDKFGHGRSSRQELFCKKDVLKNFTKFTGSEASNFIKKRDSLLKNTFFL